MGIDIDSFLEIVKKENMGHDREELLLEMLDEVSIDDFSNEPIDLEALERILDRVKELYEKKPQMSMTDNRIPHQSDKCHACRAGVCSLNEIL